MNRRNQRGIQLPVVRGDRVAFPKDARCPWCRKRKVREPHSMAILNGGAMRRVRKNEYIMASDTAAFLSLTWHGAHSTGTGVMPVVFASVYVADEVAGGQFELYFANAFARSYALVSSAGRSSAGPFRARPHEFVRQPKIIGVY